MYFFFILRTVRITFYLNTKPEKKMKYEILAQSCRLIIIITRSRQPNG